MLMRLYFPQVQVVKTDEIVFRNGVITLHSACRCRLRSRGRGRCLESRRSAQHG